MARRSRLTVAVVASVAGFLAVAVLATVWVAGHSADDVEPDLADTTPALSVDDWVLTVGELEAELAAIDANQLYWQVRLERGDPLRSRIDDEGNWAQPFVLEVLNDRLRFHLAGRALEARGGSVLAADRDTARRILRESLVGGAVLAGGEDATLDVVLEQFGPVTSANVVQGLAEVSALRRVLADELGPGAGEDEIEASLDEALAAEAGAARIDVDPRYGVYDPLAGQILPPPADEPAELELVPEGAPAEPLPPPPQDGPQPGDPVPPSGTAGSR